MEFESTCAAISDLSLFLTAPNSTGQRREVGKERESRIEEDKMEKRGEHWTSRLGEALREEKGAGGFRIFTANIPFSTRHPVEKRQFILVIDLAAPLFLLLGILFPEEGAIKECRGRVRWGGVQ